MTNTADQLKKEIVDLQTEIKGLDVQRIERDNIMHQKAKIQSEIDEKSKELAVILHALEKAREAKKQEEAAKNKEIEERMTKVSISENTLRGIEENQRKNANKQIQHATDLNAREARINERDSFVTQRETNLAVREKTLLERELSHSKVVQDHEERVKAHISRESDLNLKDQTLALRESHGIEDKKAVEVQWNLINKGHAEIDAKKASLEGKESLLIEHASALHRREKDLDAKEADICAREKDVEQKKVEIERKAESVITISKDHDLREFELRNKERTLEKRERLIYLKEQENDGGK